MRLQPCPACGLGQHCTCGPCPECDSKPCVCAEAEGCTCGEAYGRRQTHDLCDDCKHHTTPSYGRRAGA